jgi:gamma-glutamyltranspeptidase/glutathione hydrolase
LARGPHGAVVAPHHLAAEAGLDVLRAGGSAVDAAIATNAVLAVVMPSGCGLGGDAFWLIWDEASGTQSALNGSGRSPAGSDAAALRARGLTSLPRRGPLSITVPGAVRSWADAHARHGRLPVARVLASAIDLALDGFPASPAFIEAVESTAPAVADTLGRSAGFFSVFRPQGRQWHSGERVRLPALGSTLETLASSGFDAFYEGALADRQVAALDAVGAMISAADMREHRSTWETPLSVDYRGVRVTSHPPNSSGLVALELIGILGQLDPPGRDAFGATGVTDPLWIHAGVEASKLAMADRDAWLTDPGFRDIPVDRLLDPAYHARLARSIDLTRASRPAPSTNPIGGGTIFLGAVDRDGNAVSLIQSNYLGFGSGVADPATGIHYQNRGSYFSLDPEHPNVLEPRKRTLHTLLPGMLFRDRQDGRGHRPWIVAGSMGGDAQPQIHAQFVSAVVDGGVDVRTAVAAPRWYVEPRDHFVPPVDVRLERRHEPGVSEALAALGHPLAPTEAFDGGLGHEHAIELVDGGPAVADGSVAAATDPRSEGLPAVW